MTDHDTDTPTRRDFLKTGAVLGTGAAAAALLPGIEAAAEVAEAPTAKPAEKKGYQVTQHVRDYYRSARI